VAEIFQWKGALDSKCLPTVFTESEIDHIGEEIADVFIYSTRLCSICHIDLAKTVRFMIKGFEGGTFYPVTATWDTYSFRELSEDILKSPLRLQHFSTDSPRDIAFDIHARLGKISELFLSKQESDCVPGLYGWSQEDVGKLANSVAYICILLACLSKIIGRNMGICIHDKFTKNAKKYPVELVKGSSAKYTAYAKHIQGFRAAKYSSTFLAISCFASALLGVVVGVKLVLQNPTASRWIKL
jgi:dCTP diphosphatase